MGPLVVVAAVLLPVLLPVAAAVSGPPLWSFLYRRLAIRSVIFRLFSSETAHNGAIAMGGLVPDALLHLMSTGTALAPDVQRDLAVTISRPTEDELARKEDDLVLDLPLGLSAGFDTNGKLPKVMEALGFGYVSVGTVTLKPCAGNDRPRLGRLVAARSLLVNKGLRNEGIHQVATRVADSFLGKRRTPSRDNRRVLTHRRLRVGLSIGPTNCIETAEGPAQVDDIVGSFEWMCDTEQREGYRFAYLELNISCPNNHGASELTKPAVLDSCLERVGEVMTRFESSTPLFIKFPTEVSWDHARELLEVIISHNVSTVIIGNLVKDREHNPILQAHPEELEKCGKGNFSGLPCRAQSNEMIRRAYCAFGNKLQIIGCGGIFSAEDAFEKVRLGASALQLQTGLILEGPGLPFEINTGLRRLVKEAGFDSLSQAVGSACRGKQDWSEGS
jgi:dihydroorotate dehydrogenase